MTDDITAEFAAEDEFDAAEDFYPFVPSQAWAVLNTDIDSDALGVLAFVMAHLNPLSGKFEARFARNRIGERFSRSLDWVDKRLAALVEAGAMTKQHMFYLDAADRSANAPRSPELIDPETGRRRAQAANRMRVRMSPPGGAAYAGPVHIGEYYQPERITDRQTAAGGAAAQRPPSEQGKPRKSSKTAAQGGAAAQRRGGAAAQRRGGAAAQRPKQSRKGTTEEGNKSVRPEANARATNAAADDGRTDGGSNPIHEQPTAPVMADVSAAAALVSAESLQADLARIDMRPRQRARLVAAVDTALLRFSSGQVARYLAVKAAEAQTATWLLGAFEDYPDAIAQQPVPACDVRQDRALLAELADAAAADVPDPEPCAEHPTIPRRADGECAACFVARVAVDNHASETDRRTAQPAPAEAFAAPGITFVPSRLRASSPLSSADAASTPIPTNV